MEIDRYPFVKNLTFFDMKPMSAKRTYKGFFGDLFKFVNLWDSRGQKNTDCYNRYHNKNDPNQAV